MPRSSRKKSESGYLHLIPKGNSGQILFEYPEDKQFFLCQLEKYTEEVDVGIRTYCLMDNHVHLLAYDPQDHTPLLMEKLCTGYALYYNRKYRRSGHVFGHRYFSEAVEDEDYLFSAFRYILNNPVIAGICAEARDYPWSSYHLYGKKQSFVDSEFFRRRIGSRKELDDFLRMPSAALFTEYDSTGRSDAWALEVIRTLLGVPSGTALQSFGKYERDRAIRILRDAGLSKRQMQRLTGLGERIIANACRTS